MPLRKFSLHPPSLLTPSSILMTIANGSSTLNATQLGNLRTVLTSVRLQANERLVIRDANKKNLVDRQLNEKRMAEDSARLKELERSKKREEEERKEKEKTQKIEKERLQREKDAQERRRKEEEEFREIKKKEEELKIKEDEEKRLEAIKLAREAKERMEKEKEKKRLEEEAEAAAQAIAAAAAAAAAVATAAAEAKAAAEAELAREKAQEEGRKEDVEMEQAEAVDFKVLDSTTSANAQGEWASFGLKILLPGHSSLLRFSVPTINIAGSVEPEEDEDGGDQPRPPVRDSKKKKRKRDQVVDSDDEDGKASNNDSDSDTQPLAQKVRKLDASSSASGTLGVKNESPTPSPMIPVTSLKAAPSTSESTIDPFEGLKPIERKLKEDKFVKHSIPIRPPAPGTATAFYLPTQSLVPPKPVSVAPTSTPKRQADVSGDFSTAKPGTQIAHHTFHTWADAYLRPFGEDDLAFLAPKPDDWTPYFIPPLGKHFTEQWEEEDHDLSASNASHYASPLEPPPLPRIKLDALNEDALGSEVVTLGPLSERLVAALAFTSGGREDTEDEGPSSADGVHPNGIGMDHTAQLADPGAQTRPLDAVELEERIKRELRFIGLLPEDEVDWSSREDDEISSALRSCQRQLHRQTTVNEARKVVLSRIVKDRMAYQDYEATRDAQERVIENGWLKRQKTQVKKKGKAARDRNRNKKDKEAEEDAEGGVDGTGKQPLSLSLLQAVDRRHVLIESFRPFFEEEKAGRFWGIPTRSVYEGLVEETEDGELKGELVE
ncbi:BQ2448_5605 [Microbotryum intermedium]|uniref:BQ2448_5605 protein n=1 Tax=Microbotryum intermedium TaxID=269621 RepID=A0A238F2M7_9BASI|nr:BQ2448_5605 [Microbotryum intermedium]